MPTDLGPVLSVTCCQLIEFDRTVSPQPSYFCILLHDILLRTFNISTPLMMENPVRSQAQYVYYLRRFSICICSCIVMSPLCTMPCTSPRRGRWVSRTGPWPWRAWAGSGSAPAARTAGGCGRCRSSANCHPCWLPCTLSPLALKMNLCEEFTIMEMAPTRLTDGFKNLC